VNCYVVAYQGEPGSGERRVFLVDSGYPGLSGPLFDALASIGVAPSQLTHVFYTHTHIDHMGGGPDIAARCDAEHVLWEDWRDAAADWDGYEAARADWRKWLGDVVEDEELRAIMGSPAPAMALGRSPIEPARFLETGECFALGEHRLSYHPCRGHDIKHALLYDAFDRTAFTGDVILPMTTPLVRLMGDDTGEYLASLERLKAFGIETAYPGHGNPFSNVPQRVEKSRDFVFENHEQLLGVLAERGERSLWQLAVEMNQYHDIETSSYNA